MGGSEGVQITQTFAHWDNTKYLWKNKYTIRDWGNCKRSTLPLNSQKYISAYDGGLYLLFNTKRDISVYLSSATYKWLLYQDINTFIRHTDAISSSVPSHYPNSYFWQYYAYKFCKKNLLQRNFLEPNHTFHDMTAW